MLPETSVVGLLSSTARQLNGGSSMEHQKLKSFEDQSILLVRQHIPDSIQNKFTLSEVDNLRELTIIQDSRLPPLDHFLARFNCSSLSSLHIVDCPLHDLADESEMLSRLSLRSLVLSSTHLRKIPASIFRMVTLEIFKIDRNYLDEIPSEIGNLQNLKTFCCDFQRPKLRSLPHSIEKLGRLEVLSISGNRLDDISFVVAFPRLRYLKADRNRLTHLPVELVNLKELSVLDVSHNRLLFIPPGLVDLLSRLYRFSYFNVTLQPRFARDDRKQLMLHLEMQHLISHLTTTARSNIVPEVTIALVGESRAGKCTLLEALKSEGGICRSEFKHSVASSGKGRTIFDVHHFELKNDGGGEDPCYVSALVMSNNILDNFTRNIDVDLYLLAVDLTTLELHRGSQHLFLRHLSRLQMWLKALYEIAPDTPVLIVGTHAELVRSLALSEIWRTVETLLDQSRHHHSKRYFKSFSPYCLLCSPKENVVRHAFVKSKSCASGFVDLSIWMQNMGSGAYGTETPQQNGHISSDGDTCESIVYEGFSFPHVVGFYEIDSRKSFPKDAKKSNLGVEQLRSAIIRLTTRSSKLGIPSNWQAFARHIATIKDKACHITCIPIQDVIAIARSFEISPNHLPYVLHYFHNRGKLIYCCGDDLLSKLVVVNPSWFVQTMNNLIEGLECSTVLQTTILEILVDKEIDKQLYKAGSGMLPMSNGAHWLLGTLQKFEVCVSLPDQCSNNRYFLMPNLLESGAPSQDSWPDIPDWDEKQITCDVIIRTLKPGFFVDLVLRLNKDGRRYLQVLSEPSPIFRSHHIVFFTSIDSGGCDDCFRVRQRMRETFKVSTTELDQQTVDQDDIVHKVHISLNPKLCSLGVQVRGVSPCCTMKAVLGFLDLFLDDFSSEEATWNHAALCCTPDSCDTWSRWRTTVSVNSDCKQSLMSMPSSEENEDREMYLLCPKCVLLRQTHPERISYPCPSFAARRRAICSKWHNLGSWTRVATGDYRFTSLDVPAVVSLNTLPEHEHPRLVLILPPSTNVSNNDWYLSSRMKFLEGFEVHFLCEYTGYWHMTEDVGYRLNQSKQFVERIGSDQLPTLLQLALPFIQCTQGVSDDSQSGRLLAPVVTDLIQMYDYLRNTDQPLQSDPCAWIVKHKDRVVGMLSKVLANAYDKFSDIYSKTSTSIGADMIFEAASPANRYMLAKFLRLDCSSGKFGVLRPVYVGRDIRWVCEMHYEELRTMPSK